MSDTNALPPGYLFFALASMVLLHLFIPVVVLIPYPWNATGLGPLALGAALNLVTNKVIINSGNSIKPFDAPQQLITDGVFRWSRNPMYLGMVLILSGVALLLGTLTPFIIVPLFAIAIDRVFIVAEETLLEQRFGDQWKQYRQEVRRWL